MDGGGLEVRDRKVERAEECCKWQNPWLKKGPLFLPGLFLVPHLLACLRTVSGIPKPG